jgi:Siphovirus Gp157
MKLYEIPMEMAELEMALLDSEGELTHELEKRFDDFLKGGKEKIEAAAMVVRSLEADEEACVKEAKRLSERSKSVANNIDRLKHLMLIAVDAGFGGKVKSSLFTIWGQTSAAQVYIETSPTLDLELLSNESPEYVRTKMELDLSAIKEAHKQGKTLPTVITVKEVPGKRSLRIK